MSKASSEFVHTPVLYEAVLDGLNIRPDGVYVDCTTGGAGHASGILSRLGAGGLLIALDQDDEALAAAAPRLAAVRGGGTFRLVKSNFRRLAAVLAELELSGVDGILADLGVSSRQLDAGQRGFSYHLDGPLDMRMDRERPLTASEVINTWSETELTRIFADYGEERYSRRLAAAVVRRREQCPFETTGDLSDVICAAMPSASRHEKQHPAARVFQAVRIAVNGELDSLSDLLDQVVSVLNPGGRLAVITFHSLEDRMVKQRCRTWSEPCTCPPGLPCVCGRRPLGKIIGPRRGVVAEAAETAVNRRARSARLRIFERNETPLP